MKPQNTRNTRKKNSLRRMRSHSGPFKIKTPINSTPLFFICVNLRHLRITIFQPQKAQRRKGEEVVCILCAPAPFALCVFSSPSFKTRMSALQSLPLETSEKSEMRTNCVSIALLLDILKAMWQACVKVDARSNEQDEPSRTIRSAAQSHPGRGRRSRHSERHRASLGKKRLHCG